MSNQNLSFVNRSGPEAFKRDPESRKQVRSHVMREFRRRERTGARRSGTPPRSLSQHSTDIVEGRHRHTVHHQVPRPAIVDGGRRTSSTLLSDKPMWLLYRLTSRRSKAPTSGIPSWAHRRSLLYVCKTTCLVIWRFWLTRMRILTSRASMTAQSQRFI